MSLKPAAPDRWLQGPNNLDFDPDTHSYWVGDHRCVTSVTGVLRASKHPAALAAIESHRETWEPRGNACHLALHHAATDPDWHLDLDPGMWAYEPWITPLLTHPIWSSVEVIASELALYHLDMNTGFSIGGSLDLAWEQPGTLSDLHGGPIRTIADLKTLSPTAGTYSTAAQLGGYITLAAEHGIVFDQAATLWAKPKRTKLVTYSIDECLVAWQKAIDLYRTADPSRFEEPAD